MELTSSVAIGLSVLAVVLAYKLWKTINYFSDRNIPYVPGVWPFGSSIKAALLKRNFASEWDDIYHKLAPHKIGGFFLYGKPFVMVRDPEFIHRVYATDFSHFVDRGFTVDEKKDPLDGHLFFMSGEKWKYLRSKLSPIFTSGKLKWMFDQMKGSSDKFVNAFDRGISFGKDTCLKEDFARFTTDVISSCAFGIESNAMGDPDSKMREMGKKFFEPKGSEIFKFLARIACPAVLAVFKIKTTSLEITNFFVDLVKQTMNHRINTGYVRKDFIQLLLELKEKGHVEVDKVEQRNEDYVAEQNSLVNGLNGSSQQKEVITLDDEILAAQLFVFFIAGFETTASTLHNMTYLLSVNQSSQDKAREEARKCFEKYGDFTYDSLKDLHYIDNCISETLRLLPPVPGNFRICTKEYTFPDGTHLEKGQAVSLPTLSMHYDSKYFPDPEKFIPERFDGSIEKGTYAPFGDGPRICIGKRFAEVEIKLTLAKLLLRYKFLPAASKPNLRELVVGSFVLSTKAPLEVRVEKIQ
uniref:Putative cytochrome P450 6a20 n=1 Tax=Lygus hesperus TaxID=30085 RepID=A0A0A9XNR4_LYGHE